MRPVYLYNNIWRSYVYTLQIVLPDLLYTRIIPVFVLAITPCVHRRVLCERPRGDPEIQRKRAIRVILLCSFSLDFSY